KHRMKHVGGEGVFSEECFEEIYEFSKGTPRLINIICEFSLLFGFVEEQKVLDLEVVRSVREDLEKDRLRQGLGSDNSIHTKTFLKEMGVEGKC
ncbi:hypothetical protein MNBD_BACTEROID06-724, partial [hydrothermal vent metagenome]